jgi:hypothetical protein
MAARVSRNLLLWLAVISVIVIGCDLLQYVATTKMAEEAYSRAASSESKQAPYDPELFWYRAQAFLYKAKFLILILGSGLLAIIFFLLFAAGGNSLDHPKLGPMQINEWIPPGLQALTAIAATIVAIFVARISRLKWLTAREKLRLDLYERRFVIYERALDFAGALQLWDGTPEQVVLQGPFIKAFRESRFLFPANSGVHQFLREFHEHAFRIINFRNLTELAQSDQDLWIKYSKERDASAGWMLTAAERLEQKLEQFLNFHEI